MLTKATLVSSLEEVITSFCLQDLTFINVSNLPSSYCDTHCHSYATSIKLLSGLSFICNERIFHEVKAETHSRLCTFYGWVPAL